MTGWQGNDGGQGDWNPQSFGPEPGTNQYGADPYANQYGTDPYRDPHAQPDPYAQQQPPGYQTGGFPAQGYPPTGVYPTPGYPPTGSFPAQGYPPPPPPPRRSRLPMILSLVAIVIIVGAVVAIVLVNRKDTQTGAPQETTSAEPGPSSESEPGPSSSEDPPTSTSGGGGGHDDWTTIDNTADSGLTYQVPPDWKESTVSRQSGLDVDFTGDADYGVYTCEGGDYVRTFAASGDVQSKDGKDLDLAATMTDFAKSFAATYYGTDAKVDLPAPADFDVEGGTAMMLTAKVTPTVTKTACQATTGEVGLVGVLLETDGEPSGVAMLVVVNDLDGGPADPAPLEASVTQEVLKTVSAD